MTYSHAFAQELGEILDTAITVQCADFGNVQVFDERSGALHIVAQRGFEADFLEYFREVRVDEGSACARAALGLRVVVPDVDLDPEFMPHRSIAHQAGYRAVQSTPITHCEGGLLGVLSTHFREPQIPSETALIETDVCARMAAKVIERHRSLEVHSTHTTTQIDASMVLHQALLSLLQSGLHTFDLRKAGFSAEFSALAQQATVSYAVSKRADGSMPEAMIVDLKRVLRQVDEAVPAELRSQLAADVVRWSISAYYGAETDSAK